MRETLAALEELQNKPIALHRQFEILHPSSISDWKSRPVSSSSPMGPLDSDGSDFPFVPFPITSVTTPRFPSSEFGPDPSLRQRPRSASAGAGDGVKALRLEERDRRRLADDTGDQPRRRSHPDVFDIAGTTPPRRYVVPHDRPRSASCEPQESNDSEAPTHIPYAIQHPATPAGGHYNPAPLAFSNQDQVVYGQASFGYSSPFMNYPRRYGDEYDRDNSDAFIRTTVNQGSQSPYFLATPPRRLPHRAVRDAYPSGAIATSTSPQYHWGNPVHSRNRTHPIPSSSSNPTATSVPAQPDRNKFNLSKIEEGVDTRTTVMIKNIPNRMSDRDLLAFINNVCPGRIDFFYLRMDFQNGMYLVYLLYSSPCFLYDRRTPPLAISWKACY